MKYQYIDMETYKRKEHFAYFSSLAYPYVGLTVNVEITRLLQKVRQEQIPFFLTFCYCVSQAANSVVPFRQRILDQKIIEFDRCPTSHTVALEDGTYCYCTLDSNMPFTSFLDYAIGEQEAAKEKKTIEEEDDGALDKFFISTLPWVTYTSLVQPVPIPADSNPRITWGKYELQGERAMLPVSVLCHHGLVDGIHIADFYRQLDRYITMVSAT